MTERLTWKQSHGSQDLYPTMLSNQYNFSPNAKTVTQVVANLGAIAGGKLGTFSIRQEATNL